MFEKQVVLNNVNEKSNIENKMYDLYVKEKIERGLKDVEEGRVYSTEQLIKIVKTC